MKEHPILFSGEMVRAIIEGKKTQTRRVIKPQPKLTLDIWDWDGRYFWMEQPCTTGIVFHCPYGKPGDRLWVRETWGELGWHDGNEIVIHKRLDTHGVEHEIIYPNENPHFQWCGENGGVEYRKDGIERSQWKSPRFMPRWASRITLGITSVRVERLQEISEADAVAEGISKSPRTDRYIPGNCDYAVWAYRELWDSINGKSHSWDSNPWVWVIEFKVIGRE